MTTSGTYSFTVNRDQIIRDAMLNCGKLDETETPTAQEVTDCAFKLNMMVKQWMGKSDFSPGLKVWTRKQGYLYLNSASGQYSVGPTATGWTNTFTNPVLTATAASGQPTIIVSSATGIAPTYNIGVVCGTGTGTLFWTTVLNVVGTTITLNANLPSAALSGADVYVYQTAGTQPIAIEAAWLRDTTNQDTPLRLLTMPDWANLPNKSDPTNISDPTAIYYEYQLGNSNLYTDCGAANDLTKYIMLVYLESIQDFNNPADTPEYPQEWFLALSWGLTQQIAPMFNSPWTPAMDAAFKTALSIAQRKDPERQTLFYQPGAED